MRLPLAELMLQRNDENRPHKVSLPLFSPQPCSLPLIQQPTHFILFCVWLLGFAGILQKLFSKFVSIFDKNRLLEPTHTCFSFKIERRAVGKMALDVSH